MGLGSAGGASRVADGAPSSTVTSFIPSNVSATAQVARYVHRGPEKRIVSITSVINAALATGDMTLTAAIGATPVTGGVITVTQSGSAAGDVDVATPTAANTLSDGDVLSITVGGTNTGAGFTHLTIELA
jgi:hypothetical protein